MREGNIRLGRWVDEVGAMVHGKVRRALAARWCHYRAHELMSRARMRSAGEGEGELRRNSKVWW